MSVADTNLPPLPEPPSPSTVTQIAGQVRTLIAVLGGIGIGGAWLQHVTDAQITNTVTAILTIAGLTMWAAAAIWSRWQKFKAAKEKRAAAVDAAVASAQATVSSGRATPLVVDVTTVTPAGQPNLGVARVIPQVEAALATTVH